MRLQYFVIALSTRSAHERSSGLRSMAHSKWLMAISFEFPQASVIIAQRGGLTIWRLLSYCGISL
jgi:hypothetical protein